MASPSETPKEVLCPNGHSMKILCQGRRARETVDSNNVSLLNYCDVCMHLCSTIERYYCPECLFKICHHCLADQREGYVMTITLLDGRLKALGNQIFGTLEVSTKDYAKGKVTGALRHLDFDLGSRTWGNSPDEQKAITAAEVTFSSDIKARGGLQSVKLSYRNKMIQDDVRLLGSGVESMEIGGEPDPNAFTCTLKAKATGHQEVSTGVVSYTRIVMSEYPCFGNEDLLESAPYAFVLILRFAQDRRRLFEALHSGEKFRRVTMIETNKRRIRAKLNEHVKEQKKEKANLEVAKQVIVRDRIARKSMDGTEISEANVNAAIKPKDLIMACVLCILSYLTRPKEFTQYYTPEREQRGLNPLWLNFIKRLRQNEGKELLRQWLACTAQDGIHARTLTDLSYQMFLPNFLAANFHLVQGQENFGTQQDLAQGPLRNMELEFYPFVPKHVGMEGVLTYKSAEMFAAMSKDMYTLGGDLIFSFQGTNDLQDIEVCLNCLSTPFEPMNDTLSAGSCACLQGRLGLKDSVTHEVNRRRVHIGFYNIFLGFRASLQRCIRDVLSKVPRSKPVRIIVVGHSMGAALATVCLAWMLEVFDSDLPYSDLIRGELTGTPEDRLRILSITFGCPKVGNKDFAQWLDSHRFLTGGSLGPRATRVRYFRNFNINDPFPTFPPSTGVFHYAHTTGAAYTINEESGALIKFSPNGIAKLEHSTRGFGLMLEEGVEQVLMNHDMFSYAQRLLNHFWKDRRAHKQEEDLRADSYLEAFGDGHYRFHEFTRSPEFFNSF